MIPTISSSDSRLRPFARTVLPVRSAGAACSISGSTTYVERFRPVAEKARACRAMLHLLTLAMFGSGGLAYAQTFSATGVGGDIRDCCSGVGVFDVLLPSGLVDLCDLELDITGITHAVPSDLDIYLIDPFGTPLEIMTDRGGAVPVSGITLTFSDLATQLPSEPGPLVSGTFLPEGVQGFATFDGTAGGVDSWILLVIDDTCGNAGSFASFTIRGSYGPGACGPLVGACCDGTTGVCTDNVEEPFCTADQQVWTSGAACVSLGASCERHRGSCCDGTTGLCVDDLLPEDCTGDQRDWLKGVACADRSPPCSEHTGACCDLLSGICTGDVPPRACSGPLREWTKAARCTEVTCDAVNGACCDHDAFGGCTDGLVQAECTCPTCDWYKLTSCADIECTHISIPTVSHWGLFALSLALLIGAKVRFGLQRRAQEA